MVEARGIPQTHITRHSSRVPWSDGGRHETSERLGHNLCEVFKKSSEGSGRNLCEVSKKSSEGSDGTSARLGQASDKSEHQVSGVSFWLKTPAWGLFQNKT